MNNLSMNIVSLCYNLRNIDNERKYFKKMYKRSEIANARRIYHKYIQGLSEYKAINIVDVCQMINITSVSIDGFSPSISTSISSFGENGSIGVIKYTTDDISFFLKAVVENKDIDVESEIECTWNVGSNRYSKTLSCFSKENDEPKNNTDVLEFSMFDILTNIFTICIEECLDAIERKLIDGNGN